MAAADAAPDGPDQAKTPAAPGNPNLDMLQSMYNLILIQSGRFIKENQSGGGTGRMKLGMQRTVPIASERFHDALDELENEVRLAQTVLRRDLAVLKETRKKREAAAKQHEAERARQAAEAKNAPLPVPETTVKPEKVTTPAPPEPAQPEPEPASQANEVENGLKREEDSIPSPIKTDNDDPPKDPLFDDEPTAAHPPESEFDFEAMFGDSVMDTGDDGNHNDNDDMMMDMSTDMDFNLDEGNDGPSLLRGLEDFANSGDDSMTAAQGPKPDVDVPMPNLPSPSAPTEAHSAPPPAPAPAFEPEPEPEPKQQSPPKPQDPKPATPPAPAKEEKTEEKAEENTNNDNANDNDMMATMAVDDLEDLFNLDDYANPENSSFDDAFFNFE